MCVCVCVKPYFLLRNVELRRTHRVVSSVSLVSSLVNYVKVHSEQNGKLNEADSHYPRHLVQAPTDIYLKLLIQVAFVLLPLDSSAKPQSHHWLCQPS